MPALGKCKVGLLVCVIFACVFLATRAFPAVADVSSAHRFDELHDPDVGNFTNLILLRATSECRRAEAEVAALLSDPKAERFEGPAGEVIQKEALGVVLAVYMDGETGLLVGAEKRVFVDLIDRLEDQAAIGFEMKYGSDGKTVTYFKRRPDGETLTYFFPGGSLKGLRIPFNKDEHSAWQYEADWDSEGHLTRESLVEAKAWRVATAETKNLDRDMRLRGFKRLDAIRDPVLGDVMQRCLLRLLLARDAAEKDIGYAILKANGKPTQETDGSWNIVREFSDPPARVLRLSYKSEEGQPKVAQCRLSSNGEMTGEVMGYRLDYGVTANLSLVVLRFQREPAGERVELYENGLVKEFVVPLNDRAEFAAEWDNVGHHVREGRRERTKEQDSARGMGSGRQGLLPRSCLARQ